MTTTNSLIRHSHSATVIGTFEDRVRAYPDRPALQRGDGSGVSPSWIAE